MKKYYEIEKLVERFLDGDTSVAEEQKLDKFFLSHNADIDKMPESLLIASEMFKEFRAMKPQGIEPKRSISSPWDGMWIKWAINITVAASILLFILLHHSSTIDTHIGPNPQQEAQNVREKPDIVIKESDFLANNVTAYSEPTEREDENEAPNVNCKKTATQKKTISPKIEIPPTHLQTPDGKTYDRDLMAHNEIYQDNEMQCTMLVGMLPMHTDAYTQTVIIECEMSILEEEFQREEESRHVIEI